MDKAKIIKQAESVAKQMENDFKAWRIRSNAENLEGPKVEMEVNRNFIRFVREGSCNGFIVLNPPKGTDNKTGEAFQPGDLLMAKSWKAPAKNFARGNIFKDGWQANVRWTGVL